jgi:hypothetical protein
MFVKSVVAVLALFASCVTAQIGANSTINPNSVALTLRSKYILLPRAIYSVPQVLIPL